MLKQELKRDEKGRFVKGFIPKNKGIIGNRIFNFNKEELCDLYINKKLSTRKIAKLKRCSFSIIEKRLKEFNIPLRKNKKNCLRDKLEDIKRLYINKNLTCKEVADIFKVSNVSIRTNLLKMGVNIREKPGCKKGTKKVFTEEHISHMNKWRVGISRPIEIGNKISKTRIERGCSKGEKNPAWLGGISFEPYGEEFNDELKEKIRKKYNYRCQQCFRHQDELRTKSNKKYKLSIHHIDFNKKNNSENNLIPLCRGCHAQTQFDHQDWTTYFQNKIINSI